MNKGSTSLNQSPHHIFCDSKIFFIDFSTLHYFNMDRLSSSGYGIIVSAVTMAVVASFAVVLRLSAKRLTKVGLSMDDYWIIFALVSFLVYVGVMLWGRCFYMTDRSQN